jgi:hypothetical protein
VQTGDSGLKSKNIHFLIPRNDRFSGFNLLSFRGKPENGCFPVLTRNPAAAKLFDLLIFVISFKTDEQASEFVSPCESTPAAETVFVNLLIEDSRCIPYLLLNVKSIDEFMITACFL